MGKPRVFNARGGENHSFKDKMEKGPKLGLLSDEMMAYYRQVSATVEAGFDDNDPNVKKEFLNNVFKALKDEGVKASQNQTVSRILEFLFSHSEPTHLRILFHQFCKDLTTVSFDRFASHVFQSLIQHMPSMYDNSHAAGESERASLKASIEQLCQFSLSQIRQFMTDTYGSHVLRSLLETLSGIHVKEDVIRSHISRNQNLTPNNMIVSKQLSSDFKTHFDALKNEVLTLCNFADHLTDANYCPVLQTVLLILHKSDTAEYAKLAKKIMEKMSPPATGDAAQDDVAKHLPAVVQDSVGSYLIELLVSLTSEKEIPKLYEKVFKGNLIYYAVHPVANYVLQKLFVCITSNAILKEIVTETSQFLEDILAVSHFGVITKLAEACKKNHTQQEQFNQAVMKAFHCDTPKERQTKVMPLIAAMQTYDMFFCPSKGKENEEETPDKPASSLLKSVNIHGSLVLQEMVQFDRPKLIISSLMSLSPAELSNLASDKCGSHVVEALFSSSTVWERNKEEFLKKIKGLFVSIACNKNGSRCLEGIWKGCSIKMKVIIAEELNKSRERMESDKFGHFLHHNFALAKFSTRRKEWIDIQSGIKKKQQMLQAILEGNTSKKKKNRKRKNRGTNVKENDEQLPQDSLTEVTKEPKNLNEDNDVTQSDRKRRKKERMEGETGSDDVKRKKNKTDDEETSSEIVSVSKKKKKKTKTDDEETSSEIVSKKKKKKTDDEETSSEIVSKKKKNKTDDEETSSEIVSKKKKKKTDDEETSSEIVSKKKKKKKKLKE